MVRHEGRFIMKVYRWILVMNMLIWQIFPKILNTVLHWEMRFAFWYPASSILTTGIFFNSPDSTLMRQNLTNFSQFVQIMRFACSTTPDSLITKFVTPSLLYTQQVVLLTTGIFFNSPDSTLLRQKNFVGETVYLLHNYFWLRSG